MSERPTRVTHRTQMGEMYRAIKLVSIGLIGVTLTLIALSIFVTIYVSVHGEKDDGARHALCHIRKDYKLMIHNGRRILQVHPENATVKRSVQSWLFTHRQLSKLNCSKY